jgi:hypothetical protein
VGILGKLAVAAFVSYVWPVWHRPDSAADVLALTCMWSFWLSWARLDLVVRDLVVTCILSFSLNGFHLDSAVHNLADPLRTVCLKTRVRGRRSDVRSKIESRTLSWAASVVDWNGSTG